MKVTLNVYWVSYGIDFTPMLIVSIADMKNSPEYHFVKSVEVDLGDVPELTRADQTAHAVAALNKEKSELLAKVSKIEDQIANLACLEYKAA